MILSNSKIPTGRHVKMGIAMLDRMPNSDDDPCVVIEDIWKEITKIDIYCPSEDQTNDSEAKFTYPKGMFCWYKGITSSIINLHIIIIIIKFNAVHPADIFQRNT